MQSLPDDITRHLSMFLDLKSSTCLSVVNTDFLATCPDEMGFCKKCNIRFYQVPVHKRLECLSMHPKYTSWFNSDLPYYHTAIHDDPQYNELWSRGICPRSFNFKSLEPQTFRQVFERYQYKLDDACHPFNEGYIPEYDLLTTMHRFLYCLCNNYGVATLLECTKYLEDAKEHEHLSLWNEWYECSYRDKYWSSF